MITRKRPRFRKVFDIYHNLLFLDTIVGYRSSYMFARGAEQALETQGQCQVQIVIQERLET